ncbi:MAG: cation diffusion facilitator family transporter [Chloroflexi bacterium]|nr:cation diffusion facilitator family transporter [Chloroflexota bacterium]MDA1002768.1 cation diffusion facilitator family transporter [Chloroflexota bacterium]
MADVTHIHGLAPGTRARTDRRRLAVALAIATATVVLEAWGSWFTGSLALLADAGHVLSDVGALALALFAGWLAARPHSANRTYGFHRAEVLAAALNALTLLAIAAWIAWAAVRRIDSPTAVHGPGLIAIAGVGLGANLLQAWMLRGAHSINTRAARLHVLADVAGSVVAVSAGVGIQLTGWLALDPALSLVIVVLVIAGAARLLREALGILMEHPPADLDVDTLRTALLERRDVFAVHEVHLWTITSGFVAFTAHIEVHPTADAVAIAAECVAMLRDRFGIEHATIQPEYAPLHEIGGPRRADRLRTPRA